MKATFLIFCVFGIVQISVAQTNIFPSSGNVGIGTTSPGQLLHVDGPAFFGTATSMSSTLYLFSGTNDTRFEIGNQGDDFRIVSNYLTSAGYKPITFYTGGYERLRLTPGGYLGLGTASPEAKLHIVGANGGPVTSGTPTNASLRLSPTGDVTLDIGVNASSDYTWLQSTDKRELSINYKLLLNPNGGNVGIGTLDPGSYRLAVNGNVRAKEVKVETGWSDFVFEPDYKLRTLKETEEYIKKNGHLPEIPSAKEVEANGINVGEMNAKLLQKIEELTLYLIQQNKESIEQNRKIDELQRNNLQLQEKVDQNRFSRKKK